MQRVLAEDFGHRLAEGSLAGAALADEDQRDLSLLARMLHRPGEPVHDVVVDTLVAGGERFADVLAQQIPVALLGFDAPSGPEVEPTANDGRTGRLKNNATILLPLRVFEPPIAKRGRVVTAIVDDTIEVEIAKVTEGQERRHAIDVVLA